MVNLEENRRTIILCSAFGTLQFIFLTLIAMVVFPRPYNFFTDHFSSLGYFDANWAIRYFGYSNPPVLPNPFSPLIFAVTLIIAALAIIAMMLILPPIFKDSERTKIISRVGSIVGLLSAPFLVMVAAPADGGDLSFIIHFLGTFVFFSLFSFMMLTYSIAMLLKDDYPNIYGYLGIIFFVNAIAYVLITIVLPISIFNAAHQKLTVYSFIVWAFIQQIKIFRDSDNI